ncbi:MAG: LysR family transcriptional regulator [Terriglobales bacterium]
MADFRLKVFHAVASERSFSRAALRLSLTQPAVTLQIQALEEEYGTRFFDRSKRQIELTPAGQQLFAFAQRVLALYEEVEAELRPPEEQAGELRVWASTTLVNYVLPTVLVAFKKAHPRVHLCLRAGNTEQVAEAVRDGEAGLGLVEGPVHLPQVKAVPFGRDELVIIAASREPIAAAPLDLDHALAAPWLVRESGSGTREILERALHRLRPKSRLRPILELGSTEAIKLAAEAGLGLAAVSRWAVSKELRLGTLRLVTVERLQLVRPFAFVFPQGPPPTGLAGRFMQFCREAIKHPL